MAAINCTEIASKWWNYRDANIGLDNGLRPDRAMALFTDTG